MAGIHSQYISERISKLEGDHKKWVIEAKVPTAKGLQSAKIIDEELIAHWIIDDNPECEECGKDCWVLDDKEDYEVYYKCSDPGCEWEGSDGYWDLYGSISVPHGFLREHLKDNVRKFLCSHQIEGKEVQIPIQTGSGVRTYTEKTVSER